MIEVEISITGPGYTRTARRADAADPACAVAKALATLADGIGGQRLEEIAEAAYRITREDRL